MNGWIGVDLDGTLAEYGGWQGPQSIGKPIPAMMERVKKWLEQGKTVKIFTARAFLPDQLPPVREWLKEQGLPELEITNKKDFGMVELWDDRCIQVEMNTGRRMDGKEFNRKYPEGRLNGDDEGEIQIAVATDKGNVIIEFKKPVGWIGLPKELALNFAELVKKHAESL